MMEGASNEPSSAQKMEDASIEPSSAEFPASGGVSKHELSVPVESRVAFKIKSSNNDHYRLNPVYGFVEPGASTTIEIHRLVGPL